MVDPLVICALATAGFGLWELVAGRPLPHLPGWHLNPRATRWAGAYTFAASLLVFVLALTHHSGIAFVTYAILVLAFAATVLATRMLRATI